MSTRRSLFAFGALLAAFALLVPAAGLAQTDTDDETTATLAPADADRPEDVTAQSFADRFDALLVRWDEPDPDDVDDATGPYTGYRVYYSTTTFAEANVATVSFEDVAVGPSATIDGLDDGDEYFFRVAARNGAPNGIGSASTVIGMGTVTDAPKPDRVTGVKASSGNEMLSIEWIEPFSGHSTLTVKAYHVYVRTSETDDDDAGDWRDVGPVTTNMATASNLTNGKSYDIEVAAKNSEDKLGPRSVTIMATAGMDEAEDPDDTDDPDDPDDPDDTDDTTGDDQPAAGTPNMVVLNPVNPKTDVTATTIMISWQEPGSGDAPIIGYQVEYMAMGGSPMPLMEATETMATIEGLKADMEYHIRVRGRNRLGPGEWSEYAMAMTAKAAATPTTPTAGDGPVRITEPMVEAGDKMLTVSWNEPASAKSITHYDVQWKTAAATTWEPKKPKSVTAMSTEITGLVNGTAYLVQVRAVDSGGAMGEWSGSGSGTPMAAMEEEEPMPTPALPLFGAFALGAGLLAAGRRRMRQRQLRSAKLRYLPQR